MKFYVAAIAACALTAPAFAQEEKSLDMSEVPAEVVDAAKANANGVEFDDVAMDGDVYEFAGKLGNDMAYEVDVRADGSIEEIEEQIEMDAVPEEVKATLEKELAGFEPSFIEKSTRDDGETTVYEFEGEHDGQEVDVEINADGTGFVMNEDSAA